MPALLKKAGTSGFLFAARIAGAALLFATQLLISRTWGASTLGHYLIFMAALNLLAAAMPLGFQIIGAYFSASYATGKQGRLLRLFRRQGLIHIALVSAVALAVALIAGMFEGTEMPEWAGILVEYRWLIIAGAAAYALTHISGGLLVGLRRPVLSYLPDTLLRPLLVVALTAGFVLLSVPAASALDLMTVSLVAILTVNAVLLFFLSRTEVAKLPDGQDESAPETRRWWAFALPWIVVVLATDMVFDLDLILLAGFLSPDALAIFGVCARFFILAVFGIGAVYSVFLPDIFAAGAKADPAQLAGRLAQTNAVTLGLALCSLGAAALLGDFALGLFGDEFREGYPVLLILFSALVVRSLFGPANVVLSLRDRPGAIVPVALVGLLVLGLGNVLLVPVYGLVGAAVAVVLAMTIWAAGWWHVCRRITGTDTAIWAGFSATGWAGSIAAK